MDSFENFFKEESENLRKSALELLTNLFSVVPILGTVVNVRKTWIDFVNYRKSVKLEEFIKNFNPEDKSKLLELCNKKDEDLFKILEFFDKVVQSESKWVIRCLTEITSMFIRNKKLDDNYRFFYETIYKANDSDMEFFCNTKKMWENKRTKFELEMRDLENTGNEEKIRSIKATINHKCVTLV